MTTELDVKMLPMREVFAETVTSLLDEDPRLVVVLADISAALFDDAAARHPDRVINVGIREQLAVNVGAGLALTGLRPIVHTFASFLVERAFEQIKLGFGHQDVGGILVSAGASYDNTTGGRTHQAPGDVALIDTLPDWQIHVPGHSAELDALLRRAANNDDRVYIRTSTAKNREPHGIDGLTAIKSGALGTVVVVGPLLDNVLRATADLDVTVLYTPTVRPFDAVGLRANLPAGVSPAVAIVEPYAEGTSARHVSAALRDIPHRLESIGVPRVELRNYGSPRQHERAYGLDAASLRRRLASFMELPD